uniref:eIF3h C-terminal domain-containing protein n=1 Tax=Nothoprocta perdicaria TaxID=30464 RepID=A0A8C7EB29_NOTPE
LQKRVVSERITYIETTQSDGAYGKGEENWQAGASSLVWSQINTYCQNIKEFNAQNLGKLFMAQALQDNNN